MSRPVRSPFSLVGSFTLAAVCAAAFGLAPATARADWVQVPGTLAYIDVGNAQQVVGTQADGSMWKWNGSGWTQLRCCVTQADVGNDGTIWAVNPPDDHRVLTWGGLSWVVIPGKLVQISVGSAQNIWGVNQAGQVWRWTGADWALQPGTLRSVSAAADGTVWGVSPDSAVWRFSNGNWVRMPGTLQMLSVGNANTIWGVQANGMVWKWNGSDWTRVDGTLKYLGVGADGTLWGVQESGQVWRWTEPASGGASGEGWAESVVPWSTAGSTWQTCPANAVMSGLATSHNTDLTGIAGAVCATNGQALGAASVSNWGISFDRAGASRCSQNTFMVGTYRGYCNQLYCLEYARCAPMPGRTWGQCVEVPWSIGPSAQQNRCPAGSFMAGLTRNADQSLAGITAAYCCKPSP